MLKKMFILLIISTLVYTSANASEYYDEYYNNEEIVENGNYCAPKIGIKEKIKRAFVGTPTGFTPQIQPSPYLNPNFGPSYMQGFYSGNNWTSHNMYNPNYPYRLFGTSF